VVYTDIAALPTVDILCFGESLPFDDATFDGIVSLAVLEHIKDPFAASAELMRVLRPGGGMMVEWPFLQPVHGYPNHYFNATPEGARLVFERLGASVKTSVPGNLHPLSTLQWFLRDWNTGLPDGLQPTFQSLTIGDVLRADWTDLFGREWVQALSPEMQMVLASGTRLEITKPE
jgi:SAM-dependent methyltransferase